MRQAGHTGMLGLLKGAERAILEHHAPAYLVVNDKADVLYTSAQAGKYLQIPQDALRVNILTMARPELRRHLRATFHEASDQRQAVVDDHVYIYVNGECQCLRLTVRPFAPCGARAGFIVVFEENVSQLQQAERLASIGTLATGVAHELNNPLNTILLSAEYAQSLHNGQTTTDPDDLETTLSDILDEAQRCAMIVKNLLRLARSEPLPKAPNDLNEIVRRTVDLADHYFTQAHMILHCDLAEHLPDIVLNATEIGQVLVNLLQNALDAAGEKVQATIRTRADQTSVRLIVQDNGPGIPAEHLPHIFDPFYSTRRHQGGMGLGLSIVYAIVTDHQGTIRIQTASGQGTAFVITLPMAAEERHEHDEDSRC